MCSFWNSAADGWNKDAADSDYKVLFIPRFKVQGSRFKVWRLENDSASFYENIKCGNATIPCCPLNAAESCRCEIWHDDCGRSTGFLVEKTWCVSARLCCKEPCKCRSNILLDELSRHQRSSLASECRHLYEQLPPEYLCLWLFRDLTPQPSVSLPYRLNLQP